MKEYDFLSGRGCLKKCDQMPTLTTLLLFLVSGKDDTKRIILVCSVMLLKNRF